MEARDSERDGLALLLVRNKKEALTPSLILGDRRMELNKKLIEIIHMPSCIKH